MNNYIGKLPKEGGQREILDIKERISLDKRLIEVSCTSDLISATEEYDHWLLAFQEHYRITNPQAIDGIRSEGISQKEIWVPGNDPKICFKVDYSKQMLNFSLPPNDEITRDIVYSFLERIMVY